jgi:CBS domain containing-hemolysin-like protein
LTRLLTHKAPPAFSRGELAAVIETAGREGALTREEHDLVVNLLRLREVQVEDVMTPRTVVAMLPADDTAETLLERPDAETFSRIPLWEGSTDNVVGYVLVRDVLARIARGVPRDRPLRDFLRPVAFVPELITVDRALRQMIERREPVAMVADEHGGIAGLVTLEDLTETLLGVEIVDESDRDVDMREVALELRDRRLARMRRKREISEAPAGSRADDDAPTSARIRGPID